MNTMISTKNRENYGRKWPSCKNKGKEKKEGTIMYLKTLIGHINQMQCMDFF